MKRSAIYSALVCFCLLALLSYKLRSPKRGNASAPAELPLALVAESPSPQSESGNFPDQKENSFVRLISNTLLTTAGAGESELTAIQSHSAGLTEGIFEKADWKNAGFDTIPSLIQTYYWAMREQDLARWMESLSPRELSAWGRLVEGRTNIILQDFVSSLSKVSRYEIQSAVKVLDQEYVVIVNHTFTTGDSALEGFAVIDTPAGWRIAGEKGFLMYRHHPPEVYKFNISIKPPAQSPRQN